ncbi:MAG: desulfoferrodoxin [Treponema sp.]|jgi:superoxide reductase|nr:desulfoferrodoxin [Treponema sp.]
MAKQFDVFKCGVCGAVIEVLQGSGCDPVCCGQPMQYLTENTVEAAKEKHVPVIEKVNGGYKVSVGSVTHPMEEKHRIAWIELLAEGISYKKILKPGEKPEAVFAVDAVNVVAREYCTLHGLWSVRYS